MKSSYIPKRYMNMPNTNYLQLGVSQIFFTVGLLQASSIPDHLSAEANPGQFLNSSIQAFAFSHGARAYLRVLHSARHTALD